MLASTIIHWTIQFYVKFKKCIHFLAIISGRGKSKQEVGLAIIDLYYPHLILCQINDNHAYSLTLAKINIYQPEEILFPEIYTCKTYTETNLYFTIASRFHRVKITSIPRTNFSALVGWDLIQIYCAKESHSVQKIINHQ